VVTLVLVGLVAAAALRPVAADLLGRAAVGNWVTVFQAVFLQAVPFLVLGVILSGAVTAFVPAGAFDTLARLRPGAAVPTAALGGVLLPGCECGAVPLAGRLVERGVKPAVALAFLLASPAINPVVLVATAVAFPGRPEMVVARFVASVLAATVVGWLWLRIGRDAWMNPPRSMRRVDGTRTQLFLSTALHDFGHAGGYLVLGGATAATLQTVIPKSALDGLASNVVVAVISLAILAVLLAICSEADAFVAAGLVRFPLVSRLVFLTVGPMVDVKLISLQRGVFGARFAARFAPLTFVCATASACVIGAVML
jgi:uncharacterized membrane protein YraQ (UPF0718 family)